MNKKIIITCAIIIAIIGIIVAIMISGGQKNNGENEKIKITIGVFNKEGSNIYNNDIETQKEYLSEVIKEVEDLKVVTEIGEYGEFITSIMDIPQGDNYYWSYYIDNDYATVGVSGCKVEEGKTYNFKIEKFEQ